MLQLLLTRTNQNKPELCRCGLSPGFVWCQVGAGGKGVAKYSSLHIDMAMCEGGDIKILSHKNLNFSTKDDNVIYK
jgi:hypothetical protein